MNKDEYEDYFNRFMGIITDNMKVDEKDIKVLKWCMFGCGLMFMFNGIVTFIFALHLLGLL